MILDATGAVRDMFTTLSQGLPPPNPDPAMLAALDAALAGNLAAVKAAVAPAPVAAPANSAGIHAGDADKRARLPRPHLPV